MILATCFFMLLSIYVEPAFLLLAVTMTFGLVFVSTYFENGRRDREAEVLQEQINEKRGVL